MHKTTSVDEQLKTFEPLLKAVVGSFVDRRDYDETADALNEARIAAWKAIITYQKNKKAKLSHYISSCVRNRMVDLKRRKVPSLRYFSTLNPEADLNLELDRVTSFNPFNCIEFDLTCRDLLTDEEYNLFKEYYVYGYTYQEIIANRNGGIEMVKSKSKLEGDLRSCLRLIKQRLKSEEDSLR